MFFLEFTMQRGIFLLLTWLAALPLAAHAGHEHAMDKAKATVAQAGERMQKAGQTVQKAAREAETLAGEAKDAVANVLKAQAEPMELLRESLNSHWHNKIVHFPVALGIFGVLFFVASLRWPSYLWPSRVLLGAALLFGLAALRSGEAAEEAFRGTHLMKTVDAHENAAKLALLCLALQLLLTWFPSLRKWSWMVGVLAVFGILATGALGGVLASS
jgi:uncharacterized membrane protein